MPRGRHFAQRRWTFGPIGEGGSQRHSHVPRGVRMYIRLLIDFSTHTSRTEGYTFRPSAVLWDLTSLCFMKIFKKLDDN